MNGREFIDSARRLVANGHAADVRSAVSRAYYAAFHAVRDYFFSCDIRFSESSPEAHTKMPQILGNTNVPAAAKLGSTLLSLREDRNCADYALSDPAFEDSTNANIRIKIAEATLASVDALSLEPEKTNMRRLLRLKARQMGVNVVGND